MNTELGELGRTDGVLDALLFNRWGEVIFPRQEVYQDPRIVALGKTIAICFQLLEWLNRDTELIDIVYSERRVVIKKSERFFLVAVCSVPADVSLVKLTTNVVAESLKRDKQLDRLLKRQGDTGRLLSEAHQVPEWKELIDTLGGKR
jgi:hypothetical protein